MAPPPQDDTKIALLRISIDELKSRYAILNSIHDQLRVRVLAMLTVVTGFSAYVYANFKDTLPEDLNSISLSVIGLGALVYTIFILARLLRSTEWTLPMDIPVIKNAYLIHGTELAYLQYVQDEYISAVDDNRNTTTMRAKLFDRAIISLVISVIIVVILKEGQ